MINQRQDQIREKFRTFTSNDDKWEYLIALAKNHTEPEGMDKSDEYIIPGCSTTMYLVPKYNNGIIHFDIGTVSRGTTPFISLGLAELAMFIYNDATPSEILATDKGFFKEIGLDIGLTPTRNNGFASILDRIYKFAEIFNVIFPK